MIADQDGYDMKLLSLTLEHYITPWWQWRKARKLRKQIHDRWMEIINDGGTPPQAASPAPAGEENEVIRLDQRRDGR